MSEPEQPSPGRKRVRVRQRVRVKVRQRLPQESVGGVRRLWEKAKEHRRELLIWAAFAVFAVALIVFAVAQLSDRAPPPPE